jgi:hypothetical protein
MSIDYISDALVRLEVARNQIDVFTEKCKKFFETNPSEIICEIEQQGSIKIVRYRFVVKKSVPSTLNIPVTICIAQLRPILDHMVYGLSQISGASPSCGIDFPVYRKESSIDTKDKTFETWIQKYQSTLSKFPKNALIDKKSPTLQYL